MDDAHADHQHDHRETLRPGQAHQHAHDHSHAHEHGHTHSHNHDHAEGSSETRIAIAALLTGVFMFVELAGGYFAGSLALLADAGHMLSDFASLILAWFGFRMARRPADLRRTYGFRRFSVLAAFVNGLALVAITIWIAIEAAMRLASPQPVNAITMMAVGAGGVLVNLASFLVLHGGDRDNLNIRGALLHVLGDLFGSIAAMVAAGVILASNWSQADPLLSLLVALIIVRSAWALINESGHILLEGTPRHLDIKAVALDLVQSIEGVLDVHHAHAWSLDEKRSMMTLHARVADGAQGPETVARIKQRLAQKHRVEHATVEIEVDNCAEPDCD